MDNTTRHRLALRLAILALLAEVLLVTAITLRVAPAGAPLYAGLVWSLVKTLPLLVLLPGLVRGNPRSSAWLCFLLCGYFIGAVLTASMPVMRVLGLLETAVVSAGFVAALLATRWGRALAASEAPASEAR